MRINFTITLLFLVIEPSVGKDSGVILAGTPSICGFPGSEGAGDAKWQGTLNRSRLKIALIGPNQVAILVRRTVEWTGTGAASLAIQTGSPTLARTTVCAIVICSSR